MNDDEEIPEFKADGRRFRLVREEDESGVSGTGVVAVGVEFPSGAVVFEWLNDRTVYRNGGGSCPLCGRDGLPERVRETRLGD